MPTHDTTGTLCAFAWAGLEVDARGSLRPCCEFGGVLHDDDGNELNVSQHRLSQIREAREWKDLRSQMLAGQRPEPCKKCWQDQDSGRVNTLRHYANSIIDIDPGSLSDQALPLQFMGVALGNICNLRCRICSPWASSVWASDEIRRLRPSNTDWHSAALKQGAWPLASDGFWQEFHDNLTDVKTVNFYGGEPLMSLGHFALLQKLIDLGKNKDIRLTYNTNGTIFPRDFVDLWKEFKEVSISFSIDDIGTRFEYQRKNACWDKVTDVMQEFVNLGSVRCSIMCTVSVFNALYLSDIIDEFDRRWPTLDRIYNVLRVREHHSIIHASAQFKNAVRSRLRNHADTYTQKQMQHVIDQMYAHSSDEHYWLSLKKEITEIDRFRKENLRDSHPELADFLDV